MLKFSPSHHLLCAVLWDVLSLCLPAHLCSRRAEKSEMEQELEAARAELVAEGERMSHMTLENTRLGRDHERMRLDIDCLKQDKMELQQDLGELNQRVKVSHQK